MWSGEQHKLIGGYYYGASSSPLNSSSNEFVPAASPPSGEGGGGGGGGSSTPTTTITSQPTSQQQQQQLRLSFPSKWLGKTYEVIWSFQLPLEAVIIGVEKALVEACRWHVVEKERKWTDGQEGKDRIRAQASSYLGVR